ncbi:MAG: CRTAC1 family protein [Myxococcales bacterium]|nr:CRTAC1 family protein [Myxococcales bacterium]
MIGWLALVLLGCGGGDRPEGQPKSLKEWKALRAYHDENVWANETLAQEYELTLVAIWDALLGADDDYDQKIAILSSIQFDEVTLGKPKLIEELDHGIESFILEPPGTRLLPEAWGRFLRELARAGYRLIQSEFHHARFVPATEDSPARSLVKIVFHVIEDGADRRIIVDGEIGVEWSGFRDESGNPIVAKLDATGLQMLTRTGPPVFEKILDFGLKEGENLSRLHPILVYDLDKDGYPEVVMIGGNRVLWNLGERGFRDAPLTEYSYLLTETGVIADFNGDGNPDLMSTRARGDMVVYLGNDEGRFAGEPIVTPKFERPLRAPSALTVGDIDGDRDLDVWLGQYKRAYDAGQMPSPYYDANDGYPAYLLANDGAAHFADVTVEAGLSEKRFRRSYAGSFFDLDDDGDLDLLVVSDFSGIDLYHNDGNGHFSDANHTLDSDRHLFGMSSSFGDYNMDGRLDFFVAGMASTTARRLEALGLGRDDRPDMQEMRMRMAFGNRMYLAADSGWREPEFREQVARTGWTWGTTSFDFDNDGDPDIFAANGHESGESTKDYCTNFWTHDIFDGQSEPDPALSSMFGEMIESFTQGKESWDGYQKNHLLMNRSGEGFVNIAFLMGLADEFDSRAAVSADLDLDGRVDVIVVEDRGTKGQRLHIYRNQIETGNHWIGVQLQEEGGGLSPVGASVAVHTADRTYVGRVVTGETLMGQHPTTLHFGLAGSEQVESIEVQWVGGAKRIIENPEIDRYHLILGREGGR